jgi:putative transposase
LGGIESREAAAECSPWREPWVSVRGCQQAPKGRKKMSHANVLLHFVFATHGRRPLIRSDFRADLFAYLGGIVREMNGAALAINGMPDHVHMLVRMRAAQSPAEIARVVKTNSSRWVREKWKRDFAWQKGYGVFSVSESSVPAVSRYIATQEEHHKKISFQEEFIAFLKKNRIEYDPRYIWE